MPALKSLKCYKSTIYEEICAHKASIAKLERQAAACLRKYESTIKQISEELAILEVLRREDSIGSPDGEVYKKRVTAEATYTAGEEQLLTLKGRGLLQDFVKDWKAAEKWNNVSDAESEKRMMWLIEFFIENLGKESVVLDLFSVESAERRGVA